MKIMISGSRNWHYEEPIRLLLLQENPDHVLVGDARGADKIVSKLCKQYGIPFTEFKADWARYGRAAGPHRNQQMIDQRPDALYAFWIGNSRGTAHALKAAKEAGIMTYIYTDDD